VDSLHSIVSEDDLLDVVGSIYDCVITPERWQPTLDRLCRLLNFQNAMLVVHALYPLIPAYRRDGSPVVVHVLPLLTGRMDAETRLHASAAVFIAPASQTSKISAEALGLRFELTPTESRVFELVAAGHSVAETAGMLGSAISTVKTHLRRVFDKTGRHRQAELVKLAADIFPSI
jgi:DNA-binding CsgD family transcriptional regulator